MTVFAVGIGMMVTGFVVESANDVFDREYIYHNTLQKFTEHIYKQKINTSSYTHTQMLSYSYIYNGCLRYI